jgi:hypothetical protein
MSATPTVKPLLSGPAAQELAGRYAQGESLPLLVATYRVWTQQAKAAIRRAGFSLRFEDTQPNVCRVCGEAVRSCTRRRLCALHVRAFCSKCEAPLGPGRVNPWCTACEAGHKERLWAQPGRRCTTCSEPVTGHACQCGPCLQAQYELERLVRLRQGRDCATCRQALPRGRRSPYCLACWKQRERRRRRERLAAGRHRCLMCGEVLPLSRPSYCQGCESMLQKWRYAYHQNNPIARQLGTMETRRRWQEKTVASAENGDVGQAINGSLENL